VIDQLQGISAFQWVIFAIVEILVYPALPGYSYSVIRMTVRSCIGKEELKEDCLLGSGQEEWYVGSSSNITLQKVSLCSGEAGELQNCLV
jgi:hypothetical protein